MCQKVWEIIGYHALYNAILILTTPLWAMYLLHRYLTGKERLSWVQRWGRLPAALVAKPGGRRRIWAHAVSAGEVVAAVPILRELRKALPDYDLYLSVTTAAGMEMAEQRARELVDGIFYFPLDLPWVARHVVKQIAPQLFISLESEMWPNVLYELKRHGAATVMANGRISERSYRRIQAYARTLFRWVLSNIDWMLVQSEEDAARMRAIGGAAVTERVQVLGNSKFDEEVPFLSAAAVGAMRSGLGLPADAPVLVAGSTRSAAEETEIIRAYNLIRASCPSMCLLIAPRQVQRAAELADAMRKLGLNPVRKTELAQQRDVRHLILDTMGDLAATYAIATYAFVGNSFPPVVKGGGQNLLQPLAQGKPVFFGPRTATIRSEVHLATQAGVGFQVRSAEELAAKGISLLNDPAECLSIGRRARVLVEAHRGVSARYASAIAEMARGRGATPS